MAKKKVVMSEGKKNIITALLDEYDISTDEDIQDDLKDLLSGTIKTMMEAEIDEHLGYRNNEQSDSSNFQNGSKSKWADRLRIYTVLNATRDSFRM